MPYVGMHVGISLLCISNVADIKLDGKMKYFQTDDRDDYFASIEKNKSNRKCISVTLLDQTGKRVLTEVPTHKIREFVKKNYPEFGNAKKIWRSAIQSKGYTVVNNY